MTTNFCYHTYARQLNVIHPTDLSHAPDAATKNANFIPVISIGRDDNLDAAD